ncbi:MOSC domain-containing protein [Histoplasma capsulatum G186AR]|uniref:MOSC domain-containing protein n=2 Tax=Ajellomyces capsulatus TaxID=5037 RepID=C0NVQ7_AJECG|nr:MOSC domain-containing protein [Histoplasma capsulatum G186AR]EEH04596.1 MOSC domain-containing protein [Histoplasma capsulatum G186AR]KAG5296427.1 MOSC domain-containing protein [Histoplasma capsulatum]QSS74410.1 MOSC domain-containing protein [Histoplasma capsulatum G186AR]
MSVLSVHASATHSFSKPRVPSITLLPGLGVRGDAHAGATVQHRSRLHISPPPPNLRQVHLMHVEILDAAGDDGGDGGDGGSGGGKLRPGDLGENITTRGIDLLSLGKGTRLRFVGGGEEEEGGDGDGAEVVVTGLRNPCPQINRFRSGLVEKFVVRGPDGRIVARKAGVMGIVERGGVVRPGMRILVERPPVYEALECV